MKDKATLRGEFEAKLFAYANDTGIRHSVIVDAGELGYVVLKNSAMKWDAEWYDTIIKTDYAMDQGTAR